MLVRLCGEPNHERHANASIHPSEVSLYPHVNDVTCRMLRDLVVPCQAAMATESSRLLDNRHGFYLDEETGVYERGDLDHRGCRVRLLEVASEPLCRALAGGPL
jgi:hypothetical protein